MRTNIATFEGQYFKRIYAARANIMYTTTCPVVYLDGFSRDKRTRTGIEAETFPNINRRHRKFAWSVLSQCQPDTVNAKDKSHRLARPFLLSEPALFKSTRRLVQSAVLSEVHYRSPSLHDVHNDIVTVSDISQDYSKDLDGI